MMSVCFFLLLLAWWVFPGGSAPLDALWIVIAIAWTLAGPWFAWRSLSPADEARSRDGDGQLAAQDLALDADPIINCTGCRQ
jgi:hypothetical protein